MQSISPLFRSPLHEIYPKSPWDQTERNGRSALSKRPFCVIETAVLPRGLAPWLRELTRFKHSPFCSRGTFAVILHAGTLSTASYLSSNITYHTMDNKLEQLTQKLLSEGVERGQAEADKIIAAAKEQADKIVAEAKEQAQDTAAQAAKDAAALKQNTISELKMAAAQAVGALQTEIADLVSLQAVSAAVENATAEKGFLQKFIVKLAENWGTSEPLLIQTGDAEALKAVFAKQAKKLLDKGITIEQVNGKKNTFTIGPADGAYKISFGEDEFVQYFQQFLRPQLIEMLF